VHNLNNFSLLWPGQRVGDLLRSKEEGGKEKRVQVEKRDKWTVLKDNEKGGEKKTRNQSQEKSQRLSTGIMALCSF